MSETNEKTCPKCKGPLAYAPTSGWWACLQPACRILIAPEGKVYDFKQVSDSAANAVDPAMAAAIATGLKKLLAQCQSEDPRTKHIDTIPIRDGIALCEIISRGSRP